MAATCRYYGFSRQCYYRHRRLHPAPRPPRLPHCDQKTAIAFIDDVMAKLPFQVERVQTDNGAEFGTSFHLHLLDLGADHVKIKPRSPRLNGKVERSHRIDSEEFYRLLEGQLIDDSRLFSNKLQEWEDYYNYRPTAPSAAKRPTSASNRRPKTLCHSPTSVAQLDWWCIG